MKSLLALVVAVALSGCIITDDTDHHHGRHDHHVVESHRPPAAAPVPHGGRPAHGVNPKPVAKPVVHTVVVTQTPPPPPPAAPSPRAVKAKEQYLHQHNAKKPPQSHNPGRKHR